jgi:hypothetical protein
MLGALVSFAHADAINNLSIGTILDPDVVPQSKSAPCIICATNQAHNPDGFGFNDFDSQGNDSTFNLFSSNITGAFGNGDDVTVTPYTGGQLRSFLQDNGFKLAFRVAIDINTTGAKSEHLDFFQLIDLGGVGLGDETVIFDIRNVDLPGINNGNGKADYMLSGFDLSNVSLDSRLLFRAQWSGAVDGGESFYIVPEIQAVPGPIAGAGIPGIVIACGFLLGLARNRKRKEIA